MGEKIFKAMSAANLGPVMYVDRLVSVCWVMGQS